MRADVLDECYVRVSEWIVQEGNPPWSYPETIFFHAITGIEQHCPWGQNQILGFVFLLFIENWQVFSIITRRLQCYLASK